MRCCVHLVIVSLPSFFSFRFFRVCPFFHSFVHSFIDSFIRSFLQSVSHSFYQSFPQLVPSFAFRLPVGVAQKQSAVLLLSTTSHYPENADQGPYTCPCGSYPLSRSSHSYCRHEHLRQRPRQRFPIHSVLADRRWLELLRRHAAEPYYRGHSRSLHGRGLSSSPGSRWISRTFI